MENLNKIANYLQAVLKQSNVQGMSSPPSTSSNCVSGTSEDDGFENIEKTGDTETAVSASTYLNLPEDVLALSTSEELENAIVHCKAIISEKSEDSEEKRWLVRRLIELRLRLVEVNEMKQDQTVLNHFDENNKILLGHHFCLQNLPMSTARYYCDQCSGIIWNVIHTWYLCVDCDYKCHVRCLNQICRICAHVLVSEKPSYITEICPEAEKGLASQNYRCAECLQHTSFRDGVLEPRLCDYNGKYYCPTCHWNTLSVIPARVISNWDFKERRVCRASKQYLRLMAKLPVIKLEELNPILFASVEELITIKGLRQQLLLIKKYLTSCKIALENQLLWQLGDRVHFVENDNMYSMQDLLDLKSGELVNNLNKLRDNFVKHIKIDCKVCYGRGYCCELCDDERVIFPFETNVVSCPKCCSAFHFSCWVKINQQCKKCNRILERSNNSKDIIDANIQEFS